MRVRCATTKIRRNGISTVPSARVGYAADSRALNSASKLARRSSRQRLQRGPRAGAGHPGEDRVGAGQDVQVRRLPGVDRAAGAGQHVVVDGRVVRAGHRDAGRVHDVRRLAGQLGADGVAGLVEVARHLEGEPAAGGDLRDQGAGAGRGGRAPTGAWRWRPARPARASVGSPSRAGRPPRSRCARHVAARAASIISGLESRPITSASGQRAASSAVRLPGPQPRSTTRRGDSAPIRAIRSTNGRPRSSA